MWLEEKDLERLATLEANTSNIEKLVIRMDGKLDAYVANHITRSEMAEALKWRDKEVAEIREGQQWLRRMLATAVTGGILSLVTAVVVLYITLKTGG